MHTNNKYDTIYNKKIIEKRNKNTKNIQDKTNNLKN